MLATMIAFVTGILVGLTGTGAGAVLTPVVMLVTPFSALTVIGTDLLSGAATKLVGVVEHRKLGHVHWKLAAYLLAGSLPGTLAGILLLHWLEAHQPSTLLDRALRIFLGATLLAVAVFLPSLRGRKLYDSQDYVEPRLSGTWWKLLIAGAVVGFLVALTSVGSGSLLMIVMLVLVPLPLAGLVGTDILFGLVTTAVAGLLHWKMGHFDLELFLLLITGEVPGVVIGSRLTRRLSDRNFTWIFCILYLLLGVRLILK